MFLAVDIGNSNIDVGVFDGSNLIMRYYIPTELNIAAAEKILKKSLRATGVDTRLIELAIVSSVVPNASKRVMALLKRRLGIKALLLGKDINVPIANAYRSPKQVGQDRLVNSYACLKAYGKPAVIVDFGTATTFDFLDSKGRYLGGLITPGVVISLDALAERAAMLPRIKLQKPKALIGNNTVESMRSGVLYGLADMCDGIIQRLKKMSKARVLTIATGGLAGFFTPYCKRIDHVDTELTLKGIGLIYDHLFT